MVVGLLALVGASFVAFAGFESVTWLEPSLEAVESATQEGGTAEEEESPDEPDETQEVRHHDPDATAD